MEPPRSGFKLLRNFCNSLSAAAAAIAHKLARLIPEDRKHVSVREPMPLY